MEEAKKCIDNAEHVGNEKDLGLSKSAKNRRRRRKNKNKNKGLAEKSGDGASVVSSKAFEDGKAKDTKVVGSKASEEKESLQSEVKGRKNRRLRKRMQAKKNKAAAKELEAGKDVDKKASECEIFLLSLQGIEAMDRHPDSPKDEKESALGRSSSLTKEAETELVSFTARGRKSLETDMNTVEYSGFINKLSRRRYNSLSSIELIDLENTAVFQINREDSIKASMGSSLGEPSPWWDEGKVDSLEYAMRLVDSGNKSLEVKWSEADQSSMTTGFQHTRPSELGSDESVGLEFSKLPDVALEPEVLRATKLSPTGFGGFTLGGTIYFKEFVPKSKLPGALPASPQALVEEKVEGMAPQIIEAVSSLKTDVQPASEGELASVITVEDPVVKPQLTEELAIEWPFALLDTFDEEPPSEKEDFDAILKETQFDFRAWFAERIKEGKLQLSPNRGRKHLSEHLIASEESAGVLSKDNILAASPSRNRLQDMERIKLPAAIDFEKEISGRPQDINPLLNRHMKESGSVPAPSQGSFAVRKLDFGEFDSKEFIQERTLVTLEQEDLEALTETAERTDEAEGDNSDADSDKTLVNVPVPQPDDSL